MIKPQNKVINLQNLKVNSNWRVENVTAEKRLVY